MKRCPRCGVEKEKVAEFGSAGWCRACLSARHREKYWGDAKYREERKAYHRENERRKRQDPEFLAEMARKARERRATDEPYRLRQLAGQRSSRLTRIGRHLAGEARKRARQKGLPYTITREYVQGIWDARPNCEYCGCALRSAEGGHAHDSASLDRMIQEGGYTPDNVVLACFRCNTIKRDASIGELESLVANIRRVLTERGQ